MDRLHALRGALGVALGLACWGTAEAAPGCSLSTVTGVAFGTYDPLASQALTSAGSVSLCCEDMGGSVSIDLSLGNSGTAASRTLIHGTDSLAYNLFMDAGLTQVWADGFDGTAHYGPVQPSNGCTSIPVYGAMPAGQTVPAGQYSDSLTLTLSF